MGATSSKTELNNHELRPPPSHNTKSGSLNPLLAPINKNATNQNNVVVSSSGGTIEGPTVARSKDVVPLSAEERAAIVLTTVERLLKQHSIVPANVNLLAKRREEAERRAKLSSFSADRSADTLNMTTDGASYAISVGFGGGAGPVNGAELASNVGHYSPELDTRNHSVTSLVAPPRYPLMSGQGGGIVQDGNNKEISMPLEDSQSPNLSLGVKADTLPPAQNSRRNDSSLQNSTSNGAYVGYSASISSQLPQLSVRQSGVAAAGMPTSSFLHRSNSTSMRILSPPNTTMNVMVKRETSDTITAGSGGHSTHPNPKLTATSSLTTPAVPLNDLHYKLLTDIVSKTTKDPFALDLSALPIASRSKSKVVVASTSPKIEKVDVLDIVSALVTEFHVNINAQSTRYGLTPLHAAAYEGNVACIRAFAAQPGANVNIVDHEGNTPLFRATSMQTSLLLIELGADIFWQNKHGKTFLHNSSTKKGIDTISVKELLVAAARTEMKRTAKSVQALASSSQPALPQAVRKRDDVGLVIDYNNTSLPNSLSLGTSTDSQLLPAQPLSPHTRPLVPRFGVSAYYSLISHPPCQKTFSLIRRMEAPLPSSRRSTNPLVSPAVSSRHVPRRESSQQRSESESNLMTSSHDLPPTSLLTVKQLLSVVYLDPAIHYLTSSQRDAECDAENKSQGVKAAASPKSKVKSPTTEVTRLDNANAVLDDNFVKFNDPKRVINRLLNARDANGDTALHSFSKLKHEESTVTIPYLTQLISLGADVNAKNNRGEIPIMVAVRNESLAAFKLFAKARNAEFNTWTSATKPQIKRYYNLLKAAKEKASEVELAASKPTEKLLIANKAKENESVAMASKTAEGSGINPLTSKEDGDEVIQFHRLQQQVVDKFHSPSQQLNVIAMLSNNDSTDHKPKTSNTALSSEGKRDTLPNFAIPTNSKPEDTKKSLGLASNGGEGIQKTNYEHTEELSIEEQFEQLDAFGAEDDEPRENSFGDGASSTNSSMRSKHRPFYHSSSHSPPRTTKASNPPPPAQVKHPLMQIVEKKKAAAASASTSSKLGALVVLNSGHRSRDNSTSLPHNNGNRYYGGPQRNSSNSHSSNTSVDAGCGHSLLDEFMDNNEEDDPGQFSLKQGAEFGAQTNVQPPVESSEPQQKRVIEKRKAKTQWKNDYDSISSDEEETTTKGPSSTWHSLPKAEIKLPSDQNPLSKVDSQNIQLLSDTARPSDGLPGLLQSPIEKSEHLKAENSQHKNPQHSSPLLPSVEAFLSTVTGTLYDHIAAMRSETIMIEYFCAFIEAVNESHKRQNIEIEYDLMQTVEGCGGEDISSATKRMQVPRNLFLQAAQRSYVGTPLHYAVSNMQTDLIEVCLRVKGPHHTFISTSNLVKRETEEEVDGSTDGFPLNVLDSHGRTPLHIVVAFIEILCNSGGSSAAVLACEAPHMANRDAASNALRSHWFSRVSGESKLSKYNTSSSGNSKSAKKISFEAADSFGMKKKREGTIGADSAILLHAANSTSSFNDLSEASGAFKVPEGQRAGHQYQLGLMMPKTRATEASAAHMKAMTPKFDFLKAQVAKVQQLYQTMIGQTQNQNANKQNGPVTPHPFFFGAYATESNLVEMENQICNLQVAWCTRVAELLIRKRNYFNEETQQFEIRKGCNIEALDAHGHTPLRQLVAALMTGGHLVFPDNIAVATTGSHPSGHLSLRSNVMFSAKSLQNTTLDGSLEPTSTDEKDIASFALFDIMRNQQGSNTNNYDGVNQQRRVSAIVPIVKQLSAISVPSLPNKGGPQLDPFIQFQAPKHTNSSPTTSRSPNSQGPPSSPTIPGTFATSVVSTFDPSVAARFIASDILAIFVEDGNADVNAQATASSTGLPGTNATAETLKDTETNSVSGAAAPLAPSVLHIVAANISVATALQQLLTQFRKVRGEWDSESCPSSTTQHSGVENFIPMRSPVKDEGSLVLRTTQTTFSEKILNADESDVAEKLMASFVAYGANTSALFGYISRNSLASPNTFLSFSPPTSFVNKDEEATAATTTDHLKGSVMIPPNTLPALLTPLELMIVRSLPNPIAVEEALSFYRSARRRGSDSESKPNNNENSKNFSRPGGTLFGAEEVISTVGEEPKEAFTQVDERTVTFSQLVAIAEYLTSVHFEHKSAPTDSNTVDDEGSNPAAVTSYSGSSHMLIGTTNANPQGQSATSKHSSTTALSFTSPSHTGRPPLNLIVPVSQSPHTPIPLTALVPSMMTGKADPCLVLAEQSVRNHCKAASILVNATQRIYKQ